MLIMEIIQIGVGENYKCELRPYIMGNNLPGRKGGVRAMPSTEKKIKG